MNLLAIFRRGAPVLDSTQIPKHVAIIMDGNGRWATKRGLPRSAGHRKGLESIQSVAEEAAQIGVKYLTLYAFSTENWKRPPDEIDFIMTLPRELFDLYGDRLNENNIRVNIIGEVAALPAHTRIALMDAVEKTKDN
ncbi:MAG: polyprenyl diphosphate synthase, partial [bacterium]|nr:polyprenyl diphosphate synthase [bacterium]